MNMSVWKYMHVHISECNHDNRHDRSLVLFSTLRSQDPPPHKKNTLCLFLYRIPPSVGKKKKKPVTLHNLCNPPWPKTNKHITITITENNTQRDFYYYMIHSFMFVLQIVLYLFWNSIDLYIYFSVILNWS